jgi:hypothetical protein
MSGNALGRKVKSKGGKKWLIILGAMKPLRLLVPSLFLLLASCDQYQKAKYDNSQKQIADLQRELADADRTISELRAHKYQLFTSGFRTYRLDTTTGATCLKLATESDWKRLRSKRESCECLDFVRDNRLPSSSDATAKREAYWSMYKTECGMPGKSGL